MESSTNLGTEQLTRKKWFATVNPLNGKKQFRSFKPIVKENNNVVENKDGKAEAKPIGIENSAEIVTERLTRNIMSTNRNSLDGKKKFRSIKPINVEKNNVVEDSEDEAEAKPIGMENATRIVTEQTSRKRKFRSCEPLNGKKTFRSLKAIIEEESHVCEDSEDEAEAKPIGFVTKQKNRKRKLTSLYDGNKTVRCFKAMFKESNIHDENDNMTQVYSMRAQHLKDKETEHIMEEKTEPILDNKTEPTMEERTKRLMEEITNMKICE